MFFVYESYGDGDRNARRPGCSGNSDRSPKSQTVPFIFPEKRWLEAHYRRHVRADEVNDVKDPPNLAKRVEWAPGARIIQICVIWHRLRQSCWSATSLA